MGRLSDPYRKARAEHHRGGQDRRQRIGLALPAMSCAERGMGSNRPGFAVRQGRRKEHNRWNGDGRKVVARGCHRRGRGHDGRRNAKDRHQLHGGIVHIEMGQFHIRELLAHFDHHIRATRDTAKHGWALSPTEHTFLRRLRAVEKAHPAEAGDFLFVVNHGVESGAQPIGGLARALQVPAGHLAEIESPARQFAHDDEIKALAEMSGREPARAGQGFRWNTGCGDDRLANRPEALRMRASHVTGRGRDRWLSPLGGLHPPRRGTPHSAALQASTVGGQRHAHGVDGRAPPEQGFPSW